MLSRVGRSSPSLPTSRVRRRKGGAWSGRKSLREKATRAAIARERHAVRVQTPKQKLAKSAEVSSTSSISTKQKGGNNNFAQKAKGRVRLVLRGNIRWKCLFRRILVRYSSRSQKTLTTGKGDFFRLKILTQPGHFAVCHRCKQCIWGGQYIWGNGKIFRNNSTFPKVLTLRLPISTVRAFPRGGSRDVGSTFLS